MRKFLTVLLMLTLTACGVESGSSTSSDGGNVTEQATIHGTLKAADKSALSGISILDAKSGEGTSSDDAGKFDIVAVIENGEAELIVEGDGFSAHAIISNLTSGAESSPTLIMSADKQSVTTESDNSPPIPSPTAAPTAVPGSDTFDSAGNTTGFNIPRGITGNQRTGRNVYARECGACHSGKKGAGQDYNQLKRSVALPTMGIRVPQDISAADFADIVAYLNYR